MFLLFDFVHLMKNIRSRWITEEAQEIEFCVDRIKKVAKWSDIRKLHQLEANELAKMSKLTEISVDPKPIERQKVSTVLKVFCDETYSALKVHPSMENVEGTLDLLYLVITFWKMVNVRPQYADVAKRDPYKAVIRSSEYENLQKLLEIGDVFMKMGKQTPCKRMKALTKDTANCFAHTCNGLVELATFLVNLNHEYVLLGIFTSD